MAVARPPRVVRVLAAERVVSQSTARIELSSRPASEPGGQISRRITWSAFGSLAGLATSVLAVLAVSRFVAPEEYGRAAVMTAVWGILLNPITWCGGVMMRFGPVELQRAGRLSKTLATRAVFAAPVLVILLPTTMILARVRDWSTFDVILTYGWIGAATIYDFFQWSAVAGQRFRAMALTNVIVKSAPIAVLLVDAGLARVVRAEQLLAANVVGTAVAGTVLLVSIRRVIAPSAPDRRLLRQMWNYSLPGLVGMPALATIAWLDPLVLDHFSSSAEVGRYQLAYPTLTVFASVGASINAVFSPELVGAQAGRDPGALDSYRRRTQPVATLVLGSGALGVACLAPSIARCVLPSTYARSADLVGLLSIAGAFVVGTYVLYPLVTATDSVWSMQIASIGQAVANAVLDLLLAPTWGARGIAMANIGATGVGFLALTVLLRRNARASSYAAAPLVAAGAFVSFLLVMDVHVAVRALVGAALVCASAAGYVVHKGTEGSMERRPVGR